MTNKRLFRILGWLEGASLLILLFIAMPLKYIWSEPLAVRYVGMGHGLLFIAYVFYLFSYSLPARWPMKKSFLAFVLASVPFGTFWFDHKYLRES